MKAKTLFPKFLQTFNRADSEDPMKVFRYHVEILQFARMGFSKATGLSAQTDIVEYREGGQNATVQKSPGLTKFPNITLERGQIFAAGYGDRDILNWFLQVFNVSTKKAQSPRAFRRSIEIVQFDKEAVERYRWKVVQCWPTEIKPIGDLDAMQSSNSIESCVLAHEGWRLVTSV